MRSEGHSGSSEQVRGWERGGVCVSWEDMFGETENGFKVVCCTFCDNI